MSNISDFIRDRLDEYDNMLEKYSKYIKKYNFKIKSDNKNVCRFYDDDKLVYEGGISLLGGFETNTNVWIWAWASPYFSVQETEESVKLLNYGLSLQPLGNSNLHYYIKSHLINSRISFDNSLNFDIHLSLILKLIKKGKFILKKSDPKSTLISYYIVF